MINLDSITNKNNKKDNEKWSYIPDHPYRILIIGGSGSGKSNTLLNLINQQHNAKRNKATAVKNNAPFINCISKINGVKIDSDNAEDLDVEMPMYNLLEYNKNHKKTTGSLWNYYRDEPSNPLSSDSESFKYKTSIQGNTYNVGAGEEGYDANKVGKNETEVVFPLKHLSNLWKSLNISLFNCKIELILTWSKNCVLSDMTRRNAQGNNPAIVPPAKITFETTDTKLYAQLLLCQKKMI